MRRVSRSRRTSVCPSWNIRPLPGTPRASFSKHHFAGHFIAFDGSHNMYFARRLRSMLVYQKPADGIYALSMFPDGDVTWGTSDTSANKLCLRDTSIPVVVWIIGTVTNVWFYDQHGNPHNKVSIGVTPLTAHAMNKGRRILSQFARPPQSTSSHLSWLPLIVLTFGPADQLDIESWSTHISASRWQTMRIPKRKESVVSVPLLRYWSEAHQCSPGRTFRSLLQRD